MNAQHSGETQHPLRPEERCSVVIGEQHGERVICGAVREIHGPGLGRIGGHDFRPPNVVQVGWMNPATGVMCDCPVYESSPHAKSVPVYREVNLGTTPSDVGVNSDEFGSSPHQEIDQ